MQEVKKGVSVCRESEQQIVQGISLLLRGFLQQCCLLKRILAYNPAVNENVAFSDSVDALCGELSLPPLSSFLHGDVLNSTQSQLIARSLQRLQQRHDQLNFDHIQCRLVRHHLLHTPLMVLPSQFQILRNTMFFDSYPSNTPFTHSTSARERIACCAFRAVCAERKGGFSSYV